MEEVDEEDKSSAQEFTMVTRNLREENTLNSSEDRSRLFKSEEIPNDWNINRVSDLVLDIGLSCDNEAKQNWIESSRPKFISDIDEMSTKRKTMKFPPLINWSDSDYVSDDEITRSISSD
jgi:hypothetical protein